MSFARDWWFDDVDAIDDLVRWLGRDLVGIIEGRLCMRLEGWGRGNGLELADDEDDGGFSGRS